MRLKSISVIALRNIKAVYSLFSFISNTDIKEGLTLF